MSNVSDVLDDVLHERTRQEHIGAVKRSNGVPWRSVADPEMGGGDDRRYVVLGEEFGEIANATLEQQAGTTGADDAHLREELVQVAAVAVAWCEAIDQRRTDAETRCAWLSRITEQRCVLDSGHGPDSRYRFHRFARPGESVADARGRPAYKGQPIEEELADSAARAIGWGAR